MREVTFCSPPVFIVNGLVTIIIVPVPRKFIGLRTREAGEVRTSEAIKSGACRARIRCLQFCMVEGVARQEIATTCSGGVEETNVRSGSGAVIGVDSKDGHSVGGGGKRGRGGTCGDNRDAWGDWGAWNHLVFRALPVEGRCVGQNGTRKGPP